MTRRASGEERIKGEETEDGRRAGDGKGDDKCVGEWETARGSEGMLRTADAPTLGDGTANDEERETPAAVTMTGAGAGLASMV